MKKGFWVGFTAIFSATLLIGILVKYWDSPDINKILSLVGVVVSALAILFVVRNTNRQIKNQNLQTYRPHVVIYLHTYSLKKVSDLSNPQKAEYFKAMQENKVMHIDFRRGVELNNSKNSYSLIVNIIVSNIGYGIADNLRLKCLTMNGEFEKEMISEPGEKILYYPCSKLDNVRHLKKDENKEVQLYIDLYNLHHPNEWIHLLLFYTDLNKNVHSTIIMINIGLCDIVQFTIIPSNTNAFENILNDRNINYQKLMKEYAETV